MKVFQIGFNKCGTTSIHQRLLRLGFKSVHHKGGRIALVMDENVQAGRHILTGLEEFDAFTDLVFLSSEKQVLAFKHFPEIERTVPDAMFILNIRPKEDWLGSYRDHPVLVERMMSVHGLPDADAVMEHISSEWDSHLAAVQSGLPAEKLLVFDITTDPASKIDRFLGVDCGLGDTLELANYTDSGLTRFLHESVPERIRHLMPANVRQNLKYALRKRR